MKNAAVKAMVRVQFNIPDDADVSVKCLMCDSSGYHFEVEWYDKNDVRYQSNFTLPRIEVA